MTEQISAKECNLWDLLSGDYIFSIPDYQRPYSWTENEAVTLWDDLVEFWQNNTSDDQTYFVGSIVLVKNTDSPEADVIDGQQRITTLSLILAILSGYRTSLEQDIHKCLWEEGIQHKKIAGRPRLTLRKKDSSYFERYIAKPNVSILLNLSPKQLGDDAQRLIQSNTRALFDRAQNLFKGDLSKIEAFITLLFNQCYFVVVSTLDNESAFKIFSVMNNRGLSLLPSDIIKAHTIGAITEDKRKYYSDKWEDIEISLGRESFNALLSHIRMIYVKAKLHGTLVDEFERAVFAKVRNKEGVIDDIVEPYASVYKTIIECRYSSSMYAEEVNELLLWLNKVDDSDWIPCVLYVLVRYGNNPQQVYEFVSGIERIASYFYLTSKTSNQRIERYAKILTTLQNDYIKDAMALLVFSKEESLDFLDAVSGDVYLMPVRKRTYLMLRLDRFVSDKAASYHNKVFSIEHVLPQTVKPGSKWEIDWPDIGVRDYWLHKIANLIPLTRKKNSQAQNYDFSEKKKKYFNDTNGITTYALATGIMTQIEWTPDVVIRRQKELIGIISKYWKLVTISDDKGETENNNISIAENAEKILQNKIMRDLEVYYANNPNTLLPRLPQGNMKVGEFVHTAIHQLSISGFKIPEMIIEELCTINGSRKYTHRNLPFLVPVEKADLKSNMMKRYWKKEQYIEILNGQRFYIYSQWYPDYKVSSDAHKSDFLQLYLDISMC